MMDDRGASTVIGAILVLAILGGAILYVNAFHVPRQGETMESDARAVARASMLELQGELTSNQAPFVASVPLAPEGGRPPLLAGIILTPTRAPGALTFAATGTTLTLSHLTDAPSGGVPAGDPTRVAEQGKMRVYDLGSASAGVPLGAIGASIGGTYLAPASYRLEGGALLATRANASSLVASPTWSATSAGSGTRTLISGTLPILAGSTSEARGLGAGSMRITPGLAVRDGAGQAVYNVTLTLRTDALGAWTAALQAALGNRATLTVTPDTGAADAGTITALVLPPSGTPASTRAVMLDLTVLRAGVAIEGATTGS